MPAWLPPRIEVLLDLFGRRQTLKTHGDEGKHRYPDKLVERKKYKWLITSPQPKHQCSEPLVLLGGLAII